MRRISVWMLIALVAPAALAQGGPEVEATPTGWDVRWDGAPVLSYTSSEAFPKPWIDPLLTPAGHNVVRTSPPDHVHHRGLMFSWGYMRIAGEPEGYALMFWGEEGDPHGLGRIIPDPDQPAEATADADGVTIAGHYLWLRNSDDLLVLRERRVIRVHRPVGGRANLLTWTTEQTPEVDIVITPTPGAPVSYYGLGIRCADGMDRGLFVNSNGARRVEGCNGDRAEWCAYQGTTGPLRGFALFDHPDNPRYPTGWFAMNDFGYETASLPAFADYPLAAGETLRLTYGAVAFDGSASTPFLDECYEQWLAANPAESPRASRPEVVDRSTRRDDRIVFDAPLGGGAMKPGYHPVASPGGRVVSDPTTEQRHHHGLWFTWGNIRLGEESVDFWAETGAPEVLGRITTETLERAEDADGATYTSRHLWQRASGGPAIIEEERTIRVHTAVEDATLITFTTRQRALQDLVLSAESHETVSFYGLCLQMPPDMRNGLVENANGSQGRRGVEGEPARWCAYSTDVRPARTVALFDHPSNPRHPGTYFTLPTGFLSTGLVTTEDYPMAAGETLTLTYGILVTDEPNAASVERHYQEWLALP